MRSLGSKIIVIHKRSEVTDFEEIPMIEFGISCIFFIASIIGLLYFLSTGYKRSNMDDYIFTRCFAIFVFMSSILICSTMWSAIHEV